jgi:hypothetical protein
LFGIFKLLFSPWREWDVFTNFEKKSASWMFWLIYFMCSNCKLMFP